MMDPTIIAALIAACIPAVASIVVNLITNSKTAAIMKYRLDILEKKQDKHNQLIDRVYRLEESEKVQDEKIRVADHRIDDLERAAN